MRRAFTLVVGAVAVAVGCTQDFDEFSIANGAGGSPSGSAASAGSNVGGSSTAGVSGGGSSGAGAGGTAGSQIGGSAGSLMDAGGSTSDTMCPANEKFCAGTCVPLNDVQYGCDSAGCDPCSVSNGSAVCAPQGGCGVGSCDSGFADCNAAVADGCEASLNGISNCGTCGRQCVIPNATPSCDGTNCGVDVCDAGFEDCDGQLANGCEKNTSNDPTACGSCSNDCTAGNSDNWRCVAGQCEKNDCPTGFDTCAGAGMCQTNTQTSNQHCGFCNNACDLPNATSSCSAGTCQVTQCNTGFADCDGEPANGCEVELATDPDHCGQCARACSGSNVASRICLAGKCQSTCVGAFSNCFQPPGTFPDDGCETDTGTDPDNCGSCSYSCSGLGSTSRGCTAGQCSPTCAAGRADCSAPAPAPDDGCEVDVNTSSTHCGGCNRPCSSSNASSTSCQGGICNPNCLTGKSSCNNPPYPASDDGCEATIASDPDNCGACGRVCAGTNATNRTCTNGSCTPTCATGFGDCTSPMTDNGCETPLNTAADCGVCGRACSTTGASTTSCGPGGICQPTCIAPQSDCSSPGPGLPDDGCETNVQNDVNSCGACGRACSNTNVLSRSCSGGLCNSTCVGSFGNCTAPPGTSNDDGCETNTNTDTFHCGACGRGCNSSNTASLSCSAGTCNSTCDLGYANCNQPASTSADDGCEVDARTSNSQCGSCSNNCGQLQGGLSCGQDVPAICGCTNNDDCGNDFEGNCRSDGRCQCFQPGSDPICNRGETCIDDGFNRGKCSCDGGSACASGQTCCDSPAGCRNLQTDAASCGACGHACAPGFVCSSGACACDGNADCGPGGSCGGGVCTCPSGTCAAGERCLSDGSCG